MKIDLSGKVALVTASTAGIGFAIAKGLAESGAEIIINGRSEQSVNAAIARLQNEVSGAKARPADPPSPTSATPTAQPSCCGR